VRVAIEAFVRLGSVKLGGRMRAKRLIGVTALGVCPGKRFMLSLARHHEGHIKPAGRGFKELEPPARWPGNRRRNLLKFVLGQTHSEAIFSLSRPSHMER
jgi:hypothetical protein